MAHHVEIIYSDGAREMYSLCNNYDPVHMRYKGDAYFRDKEFTGTPDMVVPAVSLEVEFPG